MRSWVYMWERFREVASSPGNHRIPLRAQFALVHIANFAWKSSQRWVWHRDGRRAGIPCLRGASVGFGVTQGRVEDSCPSTQPFPISREFINGSDAFCTSVAGGMLSAMLEKLRSAAGSEGQQCQILQQVSSIEVRWGWVRGPAGLCALGSRLAAREDFIILCFGFSGSSTARRGDATSRSHLDTRFKSGTIREQQAHADSVTGVFGALQGDGGGLRPRADPCLAAALGLSRPRLWFPSAPPGLQLPSVPGGPPGAGPVAPFSRPRAGP